MTASTISGRGIGACGKATLRDLAELANGPSILISGIVASVDVDASSPPSSFATVVFPKPFPGGADKYVVFVTTLNGGMSYVTAKDEDDSGNFTGFTAYSDSECDLMYMVAKVGQKP